MNYLIVRYIIMLILIIGLILYITIGKKIIINCNNKYIIKRIKVWKVIIIYLIIWIFLNIVPFENYFVKFKSIEDNINYYFINPKIENKFVYDDYAYVHVVHNEGIFSSIFGRETDCFMPFEKKNGSWEFSNLSTRNQGHFKSMNFINFQIIELENKNSIAIKITTFPSEKTDYEIKDSLNSKVHKSVTKENDFKKSYIIINKKINKKKYKIFIEGKEYKPLK